MLRLTNREPWTIAQIKGLHHHWHGQMLRLTKTVKSLSCTLILIEQTSLTWTYAQILIILSLRSQLNNIHSTQHVHSATIKIQEDGRRRGSFLYTASRGEKTG